MKMTVIHSKHRHIPYNPPWSLVTGQSLSLKMTMNWCLKWTESVSEWSLMPPKTSKFNMCYLRLMGSHVQAYLYYLIVID